MKTSDPKSIREYNTLLRYSYNGCVIRVVVLYNDPYDFIK